MASLRRWADRVEDGVSAAMVILAVLGALAIIGFVVLAVSR